MASIGTCGANCAASKAIRAPWACAIRASSAIGQISPVTLEAPVTATSRGPTGAVRKCLRDCRAGSSGALGRCGSRITWSVRHGSRVAWCSVSKVTTVVWRGSTCASRFIASVVLRVNMTAERGRAPTNSRTVSRADS